MHCGIYLYRKKLSVFRNILTAFTSICINYGVASKITDIVVNNLLKVKFRSYVNTEEPDTPKWSPCIFSRSQLLKKLTVPVYCLAHCPSAPKAKWPSFLLTWKTVISWCRESLTSCRKLRPSNPVTMEEDGRRAVVTMHTRYENWALKSPCYYCIMVMTNFKYVLTCCFFR